MNEQKQEGALAEGARRANGAKAPGHRSERGRFSCQRKREAVLRLLRGESLETLCRELGTTAARLSAWREAFLRGGEAALKARPADERDEENARLKAKVGELTMEGEVLREKIDRLEAGRPLARISHHPLGGWIIGCELECFFLSVAFAVEPGPVGGWS